MFGAHCSVLIRKNLEIHGSFMSIEALGTAHFLNCSHF